MAEYPKSCPDALFRAKKWMRGEPKLVNRSMQQTALPDLVQNQPTLTSSEARPMRLAGNGIADAAVQLTIGPSIPKNTLTGSITAKTHQVRSLVAV